ncbi:hypothetical protein [Bradyrhizobium sp. CCGB20]|uniref:hypothetical protein n=1 Tax=Bradyrhizobium sp. CCGB20 TaxID=2949633 RepID=UPI0020B38B32|nr:hypothetical protein [Bradyrhizobium sp. CCGB20]MCP3396467.1 hypothetical protein [Bradyrhizobium sp. CCGB20]
MKVRTICGTLILAGSIATAHSTSSQAQTTNPTTAAPKQVTTPAPSAAAPNTNTNPTKHRYWRHRGGSHPHFGSRRVRT